MKALLLCIVLLTIPMEAYSIDSTELLHISAHVGASYVIAHTTHVVCRKLHGSKLTCAIVGMTTSLLAGVAKELTDGAGDNHQKGITYDLLGIGLAGIMISVTY